MPVQKSHQIQLLPNNEQCTIFVQWAGTHRWAWNWGLECKIEAYEQTGKSPGAYALSKGIVELKHTSHMWLQDVSKSVPRIALQQLDQAYANFFRRCKNGEKEKGFPKFKSRRRSKMVFHLEPDQIRIEGKRIRLPKIGWVRMTQPLRFEGKLIGTVAISERAGKWYASLNVETEHVPTENQGGAVGIDLGVKTLVTLSNGTQFENPKALRHYRKLLARAQRQLERKQRGSNRWEKAKLRVQRIQKRIADIRANATHHATGYIAENYEFVAMEDLNASGMMKNHSLAGAVADANFREFKRQVAYKVGWEGNKLALIDQWFPSSKLCSICGCINDGLILADRVWACDCGVTHDRDVNAARNILAKALHDRGFPVAGRGGLGAVRPPVKRQESNQSNPSVSLSSCECTGSFLSKL